MKYLILLFCSMSLAVDAQIVPPYFENFESGAPGWYDSTYSGSSWELGMPNFGTTTGAFSGINAWDISLDSAYKNNTVCYLYTPYFDFSTTSNTVLSFWSNFNTEVQWDASKLQYSTDTGSTWKTLGFYDSIPIINWFSTSIFGTWGWWGKSNCWMLSAIRLDSVYGVPNVQFRFEFSSDPSIFYDGVTIDDFCIYTPQNNDAAIASIISPLQNLQLSNPFATVNVANLGSNNLLSIPVGYSINGGIANTSMYNGLLTPNQADSFSIGNFIAPNGYYTICFFTQLSGDSNPFNDTLCCEFYNVVNSVFDFDNSSFIIYPNPSNNSLIQIKNLNAVSNLSIHILDALGNTVYSSFHLNNESILVRHDLSNGIYFVRITDGVKSYCKKLIVYQD